MPFSGKGSNHPEGGPKIGPRPYMTPLEGEGGDLSKKGKAKQKGGTLMKSMDPWRELLKPKNGTGGAKAIRTLNITLGGCGIVSLLRILSKRGRKKVPTPRRGVGGNQIILTPAEMLAEFGADSLHPGKAPTLQRRAGGDKLTPEEKLTEPGAGSLHLAPFTSGGGVGPP